MSALARQLCVSASTEKLMNAYQPVVNALNHIFPRYLMTAI
jgi:hypothetical protein